MHRHARLAFIALVVALMCVPSPADDKVADGPFANRTGENRARALKDYGGNAKVEKAVADGLLWLALHQAADGHWGMHDFDKHARTKPLPDGKVVGDDSTPDQYKDDTAGTAMALLPFLAAGHTHKPPQKKAAVSYDKTVDAGLKWLVKKQPGQGKDKGSFGGGNMYANALAVLAVCEAYGMTSDPKLKAPAQLAVDYLVAAQHDKGGWRYVPKSAGDTSVTGYVLRALFAARAAGLTVPRDTFAKAGKFLDSVEDNGKGVYGYTGPTYSTPPMTAVGTLCRLHLDGDARHPNLGKHMAVLEATAPGKGGGLYYEYYATRVMFDLGGKAWKRWNLGPDGDGKGGMRDLLLARQDDGARIKGNKGSWSGDGHLTNRITATSTSLLTLQVYYSYVPLHRAGDDDPEPARKR